MQKTEINKKLLQICIDMDDAWCVDVNASSFILEAYNGIFSIFKKNSFKPTLFVIGKDILKTRSYLIQAVKMGFEIGNHSYTHRYLSTLNIHQQTKEIVDTHKELSQFDVVRTFRAPG